MQKSRFTSHAIAATRDTLLALHAHSPARYPALFESAAASRTLGRFDILFAFPQHTLAKHAHDREPFLPTLDQRFLDSARRARPADSHLPFTGGWLIYLAYELASEIEPHIARAAVSVLARAPASPRSAVPHEALAIRIPAAIIYEHATAHLHLIAEPGYFDLIDLMHADLEQYSTPYTPAQPPQTPTVHTLHEDPPEQFLRAVHSAKAHIAAGDVYQVNLSRPWSLTLSATRDGAAITPAAVYRALRTANPAPFAASLVLGEWAILSSSPERLFTIRDGIISTRPIAGTRPRTRDAVRDAAPTASDLINAAGDALERAALAANPKERAEHIMLVDLARNDLGRICEPGTIHADELMTLETYAHVHHIVSSVEGRLRPDITPAEIIRALFPGGTITGCPKVRAMQIIANLERSTRGPYTGSLGYLNHDGSADFNILIRTMTYTRTPGHATARDAAAHVHFRAGAGIVADSDPDRELAETRAKAEGLLRAFNTDAAPHDHTHAD